MVLQDSSSQKTFKNTFAPNIENETLSVHEVIMGLRSTMIHSADLPKDVQDAVVKELDRLSEIKEQSS